MMNSMIKENGVTFKELEQNIYAWVCQIGREFTKEFLERYDRMLMEDRDKKKYRNKGARQTTVKTVYGEVTYQRIVYEVTGEDGTRRFVYLLDETLDLDHVGLISTNLSELLVKGITELSYRECALQVSEMTGQTISAMGVWNVIQALGEKVCEEEAELTEEYKRGNVKGKKDVPVLFEEADGVYIKLQGKDRKEEKQDKAEIKIGIAYDGWRKTGPDRYALENKVVVAGFSKAKEFQEYREAVIAEEFNLDEVSQRILNADGASWIKKVKDKSTCFQLDPFHRNKAVKEKIHEEAARGAILELLNEEDIEELFRYLEIYRNSLSDEDEIEDAEELIRYYENNREGLLPYQSVSAKLSEMQVRFPQYIEHVDKLGEELRKLGLVPDNTYLYIQGHHIMDCVVLKLLIPVCTVLRREREQEIKRLAEHNEQFRNELTGYENSQVNVAVMLKKNSGYKNLYLYQWLKEDIREFLEREKL